MITAYIVQVKIDILVDHLTDLETYLEVIGIHLGVEEALVKNIHRDTLPGILQAVEDTIVIHLDLLIDTLSTMIDTRIGVDKGFQVNQNTLHHQVENIHIIHHPALENRILIGKSKTLK